MRLVLACSVLLLVGGCGGGAADDVPDDCAGVSCQATDARIDVPADAGVDATTCQGDDCGDLFVAPAGTGAGCTERAPCGRIGDALALRSAARHRIHVAAGSYRESLLITGSGEVELIGPATGRVELAPAGDTSVITVRGDLAVTIVRFDIQGGRGDRLDPLDRHGIVCQLDGGQPPHVRLDRVLVRNNRGHGFRALSCDLTAERSYIADNRDGGLWIDGAFAIRNSFIVANGHPDSAASTGGFHIGRSPAPSGTFEFNTVGYNVSVGPGAGVQAGASTGSFRNNVVFGNQPLGTVADGLREAVGGAWAYSVFGGSLVPPGDGNLAAAPTTPMFEDVPSGVFRLAEGAPAIDAADPQAQNPVDYMGTTRPVGGRSDMGAHELALP